MSSSSPDVGAGSVRALATPLALLVVLPVAPVIHYLLGAPALWVFATGAIAITVLADWVRRATEQLARRVGPAIGGLLTVSFGSVAELVLAAFVLVEGHADVVRAQLTGSIMATSLLGLGVAIVCGSFGRARQRFDRRRAGLLSSLFILVIIALLLPAVFDFTGSKLGRPHGMAVPDEFLSLGVAAVLLCIYGANLIYTLVTHRDVFVSSPSHEAPGGWPLWLSLAVLLSATALIAVQSHLVSGALEASSRSLGLSPVFIGIVLLALVGTIADVFSAAWFARQGKMGLALNICVGSAIQVALVVGPVLVLVSWVFGKPLTLVFQNPLDLFAIVSAALIVNAISSDGEATWFEGVLLIGVYLLLALGFFLTAPVS